MSALPSFTFLTLGLLMNSCTIMHFLGPHRICIPHRRHTSISHFLLPKKSGLLHHHHHFCRVCCCRVCYSSRTIIIFYRMSCITSPFHPSYHLTQKKSAYLICMVSIRTYDSLLPSVTLRNHTTPSLSRRETNVSLYITTYYT